MPGANHIGHAFRDAMTPPAFTTDPWQWGEIAAVNTSPNTVDVYLDGSSNITPGLRYWKGYTPTVGDIVLVARMGAGRSPGAPQRNDRVVLGNLA